MVSSCRNNNKIAGKAAGNGNAGKAAGNGNGAKAASSGGGKLPFKAKGFSPKKLSLPSKVGVEKPISQFAKESVHIKIFKNGFVVIWIEHTFLNGAKSSVG